MIEKEMTMGNDILEVLLSRLSKKGVMPDELPGLLRDVLNIVSDRDTVAVDGLNLRLAMLGWQEDIVDEFSFEIMKMVIDDADVDMLEGQYALAGKNQQG
jgi:hypothetical protein